MYILRDANVGRHRDSNNFGPTAIEAFGDFVGAGFLYWATDPKRIACPSGHPQNCCPPQEPYGGGVRVGVLTARVDRPGAC